MTSEARKVSSQGRRRTGFAGRLLAVELALATCMTGMAQAAPANPNSVMSQGRGAAFQAHALSEMESALGAAIRTHQDAINAAYLSVGWTWGADTPDALDDAAYRKAWRWGFRIEEFAQTRDERFSPGDLAQAPISPWDDAQLARASSPAPELAPQPRPAGRDPDRLASVEQRLLAAQEEIARITSEVDSLEQRAHEAGASPGEQVARKAELEALTNSLEQAQATLASLHGELRDVTRELAAK